MAALDVFSPETRAWFEQAFDGPTPAQELGWPAIARGGHTLIQAPTGSGKTLAAFLYGIDRLTAAPGEGLRLLYVSPLKALNYDIERNLRGPLAGLRSELRVGVRTGDTPQKERAAMVRNPPDILITTPESLFLLLTSQARETLRGIETVIVDEVHAVAGTKRGAHLALSLERLDRLTGKPIQRVGLSATQRPLEEIGRFVSGGREIELVDAGSAKELDLKVVVPLDDMREPEEQQSIWPSIYPEILELVRAHRSTIVFVNNRRLAERLALRLNDLAEEEIARAHHGSLAREQRVEVEELLKKGEIPCLVATSSLELGIDMGAVDLVIQVESPKSVARGLQRVGRAGHELDAVSKGRIFPKYRADLLESAVVVKRMLEGGIEETKIPRNPLDVLAQQIVAICADEEIAVDELHALVRGAYPFADLSRVQLENVLDMLDGRYPSDEFAELRARVVWDRTAGVVKGRQGARRLAVTNAGTIPDRGLFGVHLVDGGGRVGELDEEMVYEARAGQTFLLGARTWRIEEITRDRVLVSPAPGVPGRGAVLEGRGRRPAVRAGRGDRRHLAGAGRAVRRAGVAAAAVPSTSSTSGRLRISSRSCASKRPRRAPCRATGRSWSSASATRSATGGSASSRRSAAACTRRGRWRSARGCASRSGSRRRRSGRTTGSRSTCPTPTRRRRSRTCCSTRAQVEELVTQELGETALFGARFRENAGRSLLIPRRRPGERTPLWQQRLKAQSLLQVARRYPAFPIVLETYRECLQDVFDLPALKQLLQGLRTRQIDLVDVETASASPYAASLLFDYVANYMYEDDTPAAERRAQALSLDRDLLRELLGQEELRELIDPGALEEVERQLRGEPRSPDELHDLLRRRGDLREGEYPEDLAEPLLAERRAVHVRVAGERRLIAAEDAGRYRDAVGAMPPGGLPEVFLEADDEPLHSLLRRFARSRGPFTTAEANERFGRDVEPVLRELERRDDLVLGELRPGGTEREWCDPEILRRLRRASLAALRREVEPAEQAALGSLPAELARDRPPRVTARGTGAAAGARSTGRACGRATCSLGACPATGPSSSTRSALPARSSGSVPASTASRSTSARTRRRSARRPPPTGRRRRSTNGSAPRSAVARCSGTTCCSTPGWRPRRRCRRSGISSGRARSPTTPGHRCAPLVATRRRRSGRARGASRAGARAR